VLIGVLVAAAFVMILNETILSVALRELTADLGVTTSTAQWLTSGFLLTMAVVIPTTGYLLQRFTTRSVFIVSLALFSAGTLLGALAPGFGVLLAARVVQAAGTALMLPMLMTTALRLVAPEKRGATMGTITIVIAVAPALGPTVGGAILEYLSWRWLFWLVLPLAVAALVAGARLLRLPDTTRVVPLDVLSVLLSAVGFSGLLYGLSSLGESGGGHGVPPWLSIAVGAVALAVFVGRQLRLQRADRALLDLRTFADARFRASVVLSVPVFVALLGVSSVLLPLHLQTVLGVSTFVSGLAVLPGGLVMGVLSRPVGTLYDRVGARPLVVPGAAAMAAALWLFALLGPSAGLSAVIGVHVLLSLGLALTMTPLMTEALGSLPPRLTSHGSAVLSTLQQVAGALGTALFITVAALGSADPSASAPDADGLHAAFVVGGGVGLVALTASLFLRGRSGTGNGARDHSPNGRALARVGPEGGGRRGARRAASPGTPPGR
jgi:DHA2 family lincomycin resistance protein-like MFS transporter